MKADNTDNDDNMGVLLGTTEYLELNTNQEVQKGDMVFIHYHGFYQWKEIDEGFVGYKLSYLQQWVKNLRIRRGYKPFPTEL